jgi:hypothetical protein
MVAAELLAQGADGDAHAVAFLVGGMEFVRL